MEQSFASRVLEFRKFKGLSQQAFAERCGLEQGNVSQMEKGTEPKQSNVTKLVMGFPDLNPDWLLLGTGTMLRDGRTLSQLPPAVPSEAKPYREGMPITPGTATPKEVSFVDRLIRNLEEENAKKDALIEWLQEQNAVLLGKSPASAYAATPVELPRQEIQGFRPAATLPTEAKVIAMWSPVIELVEVAA